MRVLRLTEGSVDYPTVRLMTDGLAELGVETRFASIDRTVRPSWAVRSGVLVDSLGAEGLPWPVAAARLVGLLRRVRPDIVHTHFFRPGLIGAMAAPSMRVPLIHHRHHLDEHRLIGTRIHVALDRGAMLPARRVVVPSEAMRGYLRAREGVAEGKIDVVRPCFDFEALTPKEGDRDRLRRELGLEGRFVIGCVSRFIPFKGHRYLLRAAAALLPRIPELSVLLIGPGPTEEVLEEVNERGLRDRVILAGPRQDLAACYAAMDVKAQPSLSESLSKVVVEAMIAGTPVVATSVGGIPEILEPDFGILVPPADPRALADGVAGLYGDPDLRNRLRETARERAKTMFTTRSAVEAQLLSYQRCFA